MNSINNPNDLVSQDMVRLLINIAVIVGLIGFGIMYGIFYLIG